MSPLDGDRAMLAAIWAAIAEGPPPDVTLRGPAAVLPSVFDVTGLATAAVTAATVAVADLATARGATAAHAAPTGSTTTGSTTTGAALAVTVDRRAASAAFRSEALFAPIGWQRPPVWDSIAGDYPTRDGWIKLHTNYPYHRAAVESVLGAVADRTELAPRVAEWRGTDLESAVVAAGGCAAVMHDQDEWQASAAGRAAADEPVARVRTVSAAGRELGESDRPLAGIRVLDLTRVIAGPVATRFLAAYGADVLRIDPPGFLEVGALLPDTTAGKRCAFLDLHDPADRVRFEGLVATADVLVCGLRADALPAAGYDLTALRRTNPRLIIAGLNAYGWGGAWTARRGFDSLVQMSVGIAAAGAVGYRRDAPTPLPAQALDHATGYITAAAVAVAVTRRIRMGLASDIRTSLVGTANLLMNHPVPVSIDAAAPTWDDSDTVPAATDWGPARRVPVPGVITGIEARLPVDAGPLGRHPANWTDR